MGCRVSKNDSMSTEIQIEPAEMARHHDDPIDYKARLERKMCLVGKLFKFNILCQLEISFQLTMNHETKDAKTYFHLLQINQQFPRIGQQTSSTPLPPFF